MHTPFATRLAIAFAVFRQPETLFARFGEAQPYHRATGSLKNPFSVFRLPPP